MIGSLFRAAHVYECLLLFFFFLFLFVFFFFLFYFRTHVHTMSTLRMFEFQQLVLNYPISVTEDDPRHDKTNKMAVRPAKTQISLGIRPV